MDDNTNTTNTSGTPGTPDVEGYLTCIEVGLDESTNTLSATLCASETPQQLDLAYINNLIHDGGWTSLYFPANALEDLITKVEAGKHGTYVVAQRKDATASIAIADNLMSATISTTKPYGGAHLTAASLDVCITQAGVKREMCDERVIAEILQGKVVAVRSLAAGFEPEKGMDAYFETLVEGIVRRAPTLDEIGNADQYDLTDFIVVEAGTELMRRHPPGEGVAGSTVTGVPIPATPGTDTPFSRDLVAALVSDEDPNVLIAEIKGHPIATGSAVRVDPTLKVTAVDLRSGNVEFDGSVEVVGDVRSGVVIEASGDILVKGVIEAATIKAGNNLLIASGIFNQGDEKRGDKTTTKLTAGGNIDARFVSGAILRAGRDVVVKEYIAHCDTYAQGKVMVGQGGGKGQVYGGICCGLGGVIVNRLGSNASVETLVKVGPCARLTDVLPELQEELETAHTATVTASKAIRGNVTLQINEAQRTFRNQANTGCYQERDGKVVLIESQ